MSKIILQQLDFSTLPAPTGEFILGVDVADGLPKLKTPTDTIILGLTGSSYLQYEEVTYNQFYNLINTSSLIPGGYYLLTDFKTKHYIQYTDSNGNGTANDEAVHTGTLEQLLIRAISNNNYDRKVTSIQHPGDEIYWKHNPISREKEYVTLGGKGLIYFRKSSNGNQRDYDFRNVVFRRWNDGSGNYTIVRAVDSPGWPSGFLVLDFKDLKSFQEGFQIMKNNKVGSMSDVPNVLSVPYYMDNFVFTTFSQAYDNDIKESHGVTVDALDFTGNEIDLIGNSKFINQSESFNYNKFKLITNSSLFGSTNYNDIIRISTTTFQNEFYGNKGVYINSSNFGSFSNNRFDTLSSCSFSISEFNNIENKSSLSTSDYSFNYSKATNDYNIDFNFTYSNFNISGTNSQTLMNLNAYGEITIATPSSTTSSNVLVLDNNIIKYREINLGGNYNIYDVNVMTYSATVSSDGRDYFGVGYTASPVTINLPTITGISNGKVVTIKDETGAASVNPITINTKASETLDGLTQSQLSINYGSLSFVKKSNGWWII